MSETQSDRSADERQHLLDLFKHMDDGSGVGEKDVVELLRGAGRTSFAANRVVIRAPKGENGNFSLESFTQMLDGKYDA
ncbi:hypothetical protein [Streptomyces sp. BA2]|uniref:hypothetical protein n=1 Tax=Streptomyces sp. BA2 TaxID=436595 RepID=UPI001322AA05|nr:hypothetical protein [Streptomyces sp. BA2]MWA14275.1 hypothetical protein [Streptomyces sp. BA2]